jgi:hypothetical protein
MSMTQHFKQKLSAVALGSAIALASGSASAYNLIKDDGKELNLDIEIIAGYFSSEENYPIGSQTKESPAWTEAYAKYGFSGSFDVGNSGSLFGAINAMSTGTWGDGDAAGFTTGEERHTEIEDLYAGFRTDMFEISLGRQNISFGDGFIINGDALNLGEGFDDYGTSLDNGGAYWLGGRRAFDNTFVLRAGPETGLRSDLFWLKSDNPGQSSMELAGANLEYTADHGTFGLLHVKGLGVNANEAAFNGHEGRDGQTTTSIRYQGNAGVENLFLSSEYTTQENGVTGGDTNAWYAEAGWTFADIPWSPSVNYRLTSYDTGYDPLFYGFNRGYGTWFQGEVAASYAGPFATDSDIHYFSVTAHPAETLTVGVMYFKYEDTAANSGDNDADEVDIWAEWVVNEHLIISPLVGLYTPKSANNTQGNTNTNTYVQVLAIVPF